MYGICHILCGFCLKSVLPCKDVEISCICLSYLEWVEVYPVFMFLCYYSGHCFDFVVLYCLFVISCLTLGCHNLSSKFIKYQFMFFLVFYCHFFACSVPFLSSLFFLLSCLSSYFLILPCSLVFLFSCLSLHFLILPFLSCPITSIYPSEDSLGVPDLSIISYVLYLRWACVSCTVLVSRVWRNRFCWRVERIRDVGTAYTGLNCTVSLHCVHCSYIEEWRESETLEQRIQIICIYCTLLCALCIYNMHEERRGHWNSAFRLYVCTVLYCVYFAYIICMKRESDIGTVHSDYMYLLYFTVCTLHI